MSIKLAFWECNSHSFQASTKKGDFENFYSNLTDSDKPDRWRGSSLSPPCWRFPCYSERTVLPCILCSTVGSWPGEGNITFFSSRIMLNQQRRSKEKNSIKNKRINSVQHSRILPRWGMELLRERCRRVRIGSRLGGTFAPLQSKPDQDSKSPQRHNILMLIWKKNN